MSFLSVRVTTNGKDPASIPNLSSRSEQLQRAYFSPPQQTWVEYVSTTQEMCKNVFENLITIFPNQLTPDKQDTLKKELKIDNDATLKMIVVMHFIVLKNKHCYKKKIPNIQTIELMKKINSVLFTNVTEKTFEELYLQKLKEFDTSEIDEKNIKRFSLDLIGKFKLRDINSKSKADYFYIGNCKDVRNCVLYLAYAILNTVL